jgi:hypothetical protein
MRVSGCARNRQHRVPMRGLAVRVACCLVAFGLFGAAAGFSSRAEAAEKECPVESFESEKIEEAARSAPSCERSFEIFRRCSSGASGDVGVGAVVTERCEAEFLGRLNKAERQTYRRAQECCARKYRHELGTMYRSFEAYCGAEVALSYAKRFRRRATPRGSGS